VSATQAPSVPGGPSKLISCILPDDGTEGRLLAWLLEQGITRAESLSCRGHSVLSEAATRSGRLPEPTLVRMVRIIVDADDAETLFDRIYVQANIHRPGGGALIMTPLTFATPFSLPEGISVEPGERS
jgi:hypothetical protein